MSTVPKIETIFRALHLTFGQPGRGTWCLESQSKERFWILFVGCDETVPPPSAMGSFLCMLYVSGILHNSRLEWWFWFSANLELNLLSFFDGLTMKIWAIFLSVVVVWTTNRSAKGGGCGACKRPEISLNGPDHKHNLDLKSLTCPSMSQPSSFLSKLIKWSIISRKCNITQKVWDYGSLSSAIEWSFISKNTESRCLLSDSKILSTL